MPAMYTLVPTELDEFTGQRRSSEALSTDSSTYAISRRRTPDRRKERLNTELLNAVAHGDASVTRLLNDGASPNATCRSSHTTAAHIAAAKGFAQLVQTLSEAGADMALRDKNGFQPVHYAAWAGKVDTIAVLIKININLINSVIEKCEEAVGEDRLDSWYHNHTSLDHFVTFEQATVNGITPLHLAAMKGCAETVDFLLSNGADVLLKDSRGLTPLDVAGICGRQEVNSQPTKEQVDNVLPKSNRLHLNIKREVPRRPTHHIVTSLISRGARMPRGNMIVREGNVINQAKLSITTLHTAVKNQELDLIQCLLENGASLTTWNDNGETPLHLAIRNRLIEPLRIMMNWDGGVVNVRDTQGRTPLHLAVMFEWANGIELLLEAKADTSMTTNNNETVLHLAAERGNRCMLEELLLAPEAIKVLEYRNAFYHTPLCRAVENNHLDCVQVLCEYGADVTVTLPGDITLLHIGASTNSSKILEYLLQTRGLSHSLRNVRCHEEKGGLTALHIAAKDGFTESVEELLRGSCNVFSQTTQLPGHCQTALHLAAYHGHGDTIQCILKHESRTLETRDISGWTPLHIAASRGHKNCVQIMLCYGADLSSTVNDDDRKYSALDIVMLSVVEPVEFLNSVLDSHISVNEYPLSDANCEITLNYSVLVPKDTSKRQLRVLNAILNNGNEQLIEKILLHPLTETFLSLKWMKLKFFFVVIMALYVMLTLSITVLAHLLYVENTTDFYFLICAEVARALLFFFLIPIVLLEILNACQMQRHYFLDKESWIKWLIIACSFSVGLIKPSVRGARHLMSITILLSWIELLFLLARVPSWGSYVLMFTQVASTIIKVLLSFTFLVLGFTFAFLILFEAHAPFQNFFETTIKVIVMMFEYDYEDMFTNLDPSKVYTGVVGRIMVGGFIILVSIVMVNLMVGLAVANIAALEAQGKSQRLAKQAAFLSLLERFVYAGKLKKFMPKFFRTAFENRRSAPRTLVVRPAKPQIVDNNPISKALKSAVIEKICQEQKSQDDIKTTASFFNMNRKIGLIEERLSQFLDKSDSACETTQMSQVLNELRFIRDQLPEIYSQNSTPKSPISTPKFQLI